MLPCRTPTTHKPKLAKGDGCLTATDEKEQQTHNSAATVAQLHFQVKARYKFKKRAHQKPFEHTYFLAFLRCAKKSESSMMELMEIWRNKDRKFFY